MANRENNKQAQETRAQLEQAYRQLRKELPIEKVTVSQLCQMTGINRSSFYYHYLDVYDLHDQLVDQLNAHLSDKMTEAGSDFLSPQKLAVYFQHIREERETYRFLTDTRVHFPIQRSYEAFRRFLMRQDKYHGLSEEQLTYAVVKIQAGFHFMVRHWLEEDCHLPVEEMVVLSLKELSDNEKNIS